jgi:hypothetical protein
MTRTRSPILATARMTSAVTLASLALAVAVAAMPRSAAAQTTTNSAPVISGTPKTFAKVGTAYAFLPTARDANGDALTFSIVNKPAWMWFNTRTGKLAGTPQSGQAGKTFPGITIKVSDGRATMSLPTFWITVGPAASGEVVLSWTAPTTNIDGTALTDLAGYTVFYGKTSRSYSNSLRVAGAGTDSAVIQGLSAGTWYFAIKSRNVMGVESAYSGEVKAVL